MSDGQETGNVQQPQQPQQAPEPPAVVAPAPGMSAKEIGDGKAFAVLSYALSFVSVPFFLVPLVMRNNAFSLYHAKQCLLLWLAGIAVSVVCVPLMAICIGFILLPLAGIGLVVLGIMGLVAATRGEIKPLPLIGKYAEDWFKGIQKV
jgi:uncharacterized membrane protein